MRSLIINCSKAFLPAWAAKQVAKKFKKKRRYPVRRRRRWTPAERSMIFGLEDRLEAIEKKLKDQTKAINKLAKEFKDFRTTMAMIDPPKKDRKLDLEDK